MFCSLLVGGKKQSVENKVDFPLRRDVEAGGHAGYDFLNFKGASSFHLKLFGSSHMEIGCLQPDLISNFL